MVWFLKKIINEASVTPILSYIHYFSRIFYVTVFGTVVFNVFFQHIQKLKVKND